MLSADNDLSNRQKRFHAYKVFVFGKDYLEIKEMILWFGGWSKNVSGNNCQTHDQCLKWEYIDKICHI